MKTAAVFDKSKMTLEDELDAIHGPRGCDHEEEIFADVMDDVKRILQKRGLLESVKGENPEECPYCAATETRIVHRSHCIRYSDK